MVPRRPPRPYRWTVPPGGGCALTADRCQVASRRAWEASRHRRADPVQVEPLTNQQVRRVCIDDSVSALASDPKMVRADSAGLAWYAAVLTCAASGRDGGIWYVPEGFRAL